MSAYLNKPITSNKNREFYLNILVKNNKFYISCHYFVKYFITKFENEYSLEELIALSDYYKQFQNVNQVIEEIVQPTKYPETDRHQHQHLEKVAGFCVIFSDIRKMLYISNMTSNNHSP